MAIRLGKAFGGDAETWLRVQVAYDLAQARQHEGEIEVEPVPRRELHDGARDLGRLSIIQTDPHLPNALAAPPAINNR